jgi:hypothetical protein
VRRDDALARAVSNAEAAERLLAVDDTDAGMTSGGYRRTTGQGPYGVYEEQRTARYQGATAYAAIARAWAAIAPQLPSGPDERSQAAADRRHEDADRRAQA